MPTTAIRYENFFPEKVYHSSSLNNAFHEVFENDIRSYSDIILAVTECCRGNFFPSIINIFFNYLKIVNGLINFKKIIIIN